MDLYEFGTTTSPTPNTPWTNLGCFVDTESRLLRSHSVTQGAMTPEFCVSACSARSFKYAGVEYGGECYCGDVLYTTANGGGGGRLGEKVADGECNVQCGGDSSRMCGGSWRANVYVKP
jgi:glucan endo-1,3-alpha-glucosidase